jgi:peptidoglycan/LPS O-acetylase OafA/YrhL
LDGLRGVAITMVLLGHAGETVAKGYSGWLYPLGWFANSGYGVDIFFVLSGYLITTILIREYDAIGKLDIKAFYCRRILRIMPAFYVYLLFLAVVDWMGAIRISVAQFAFAATHLINYEQAIILLFKLPDPYSSDYWFMGHFWTLSMEEQFYWMWPLLLLLVLRTRGYVGIAALILALPLIRLASYSLFPGTRGQLMMMLHTGSDAIFSGCLLALCLARLPRLSERLRFPWWGVIGLILFVFVFSARIRHAMPRGYDILLGTTLLVIAITLIVANILLQENTWYHWLLERRALVFLGRISYSVYLWQQVFLTTLNTTFLGKWPVNLAVALLTGWLSYRFVELPFIRLKDKYFRAHTKSAVPLVVSLSDR